MRQMENRGRRTVSHIQYLETVILILLYLSLIFILMNMVIMNIPDFIATLACNHQPGHFVLESTLFIMEDKCP
ncbi:hypothetical protein RIF29_21164 [Crotalaria pallida]|uniref:Uncharacterized protein n=1 Tax=Crotalaria pallida TaxID=3830 RepID=A0AAN9I997_CROPI